MDITNISIKKKILGLVVLTAIFVSFIIYVLMYYFSNNIADNLQEKSKNEIYSNIKLINQSIYKSCEITDQVLTKNLIYKLDEYKKNISNRGNINIGGGNVNWIAINQFTKEKTTITLPQVLIGSTWLGQIKDFANKQSIVDDFNEENFTFTIFQRMNEKGDMLRVATNVKTNDGTRAIGTYIPMNNADGSNSSILTAVLNNKPYFGNAFVLNDYYQSVYEPLKDKNGNIIGMLYVGVSLKTAEKLREFILNTKIGKSGYAYVLSGSGARKGFYIISKDGKRDGENILETKDESGKSIIKDIIIQATSNNEGEISLINYPWKNNDDNVVENKLVAISYFKPFDWVIGVGVNQSQINESLDIVTSGFNMLFIYIALAVLFVVVIIIVITSILSNKISKPITDSTHIMKLIAKGQIKEALNKLDN